MEQYIETVISQSFSNLFLGREFLTWLWYITEKKNGSLEMHTGETVEIWIDNKIILESGSDARINHTGGYPSRSKEAHTALQTGKLPKEVKIGIKTEFKEWIFSIASDDFAIKSLKLPTALKDTEEKLVERFYLLEEFQKVFETVYHTFYKSRTKDSWEDLKHAMQVWIAQKQTT